MGELGDRTHLEMDETIHPGQSGVLTGGIDGITVNIVSLQITGNGEVNFAAQFLPDFGPQGSRDQIVPGFCGEGREQCGH